MLLPLPILPLLLLLQVTATNHHHYDIYYIIKISCIIKIKIMINVARMNLKAASVFQDETGYNFRVFYKNIYFSVQKTS